MDLAKVVGVDARRRKRRVGRGSGSGAGKTSGRGSKGAAARRGFGGLLHREGGQMPLIRRIPKRGFRNTMFRTEYDVVNLRALAPLAGRTVTPEVLVESGLVKRRWGRVKVLGTGEAAAGLEVHAHAFSASARAKIEAAGGKAVVLGAEAPGAPPAPAGSTMPAAPPAPGPDARGG